MPSTTRTTRVLARDLRRDDALVSGATLTSEPRPHPSGYLIAEVDYSHVLGWRPDALVEIRSREEGSS